MTALFVFTYTFLLFQDLILLNQNVSCFILFGLINVVLFGINLCGPYSWFAGSESCVIVCFGSFLITYNQLLIQFAKVIANIFAVYLSFVCIFKQKQNKKQKMRELSSFWEYKMVTTKSEKPWTFFN